MCLTMGVQNIMDADEVVAMFCGVHKAKALKCAVEDAISQMCPVSVLQIHPRAAFVADQLACRKLTVSTVDYFKGLMQTNAMLMEKEFDFDLASN